MTSASSSANRVVLPAIVPHRGGMPTWRWATRLLVVLGTLLASACQHIPPRPLSPERTADALEARRLDAPGLARFLEAAVGHAPPVWPLRQWDLATLTLAALYFQPALDVARAHAATAGAAVETAAARPNPTLSITPEYSTNAMSAVSPWLAAVHLDWTIETAGKRGWRMERATADADAAETAIVAEAWRVRRRLASDSLALATAQRRTALLAEQVDAANHLVALTEARVRAGAAAAPDLAAIRFASLQASTEEAGARAQIADAEARVAAAIGVPSRALAGLALPAGLDAEERDALQAADPGSARRRALLQRADVQQALAGYAAAEAVLGLELARQYPDVHLGPGYQFDQGQNKWSVGLNIDLPILNRNEGPIAEAAAARDEAAARLVAAQATAIGDVEQALARRDAEHDRIERLRVALGDRVANVNRSRAAFAAGALDHAAVIATEVEEARAELAVAEADAAFAQALIDLEGAVQGPFPGGLATPAVAADAR